MGFELGDADLRAVLAATTTIAAHPAPDITTTLELVRSLIDCTSASFNDMTLSAGDYRYVIVPPDTEELAVRLKPVYDRLAGSQHPLIGAALIEPLRGAIRFCDVPAGATFTDTDLYREFFVPFGLRYQMVIQLPAPPDTIVGYALNRSPELGEFSERDVAVLNAIGPYLAMHHRHMFDLERRRAVAAEVDRDGGWSVMTVRADGTVDTSSSESASAAFAAGGRLPGAVVELLPTARKMTSESTTCEVTIDGSRWHCVIHPVPVGPTVLLVRRLGDVSSGAAALIDLGLTPRQTEVAVELVRTGDTNAQLARSLGISEGTVKKHLEAVFLALDVDSRSGAIVAIADLAGHSSALG